jgi:hypothetical protein
MVLHALEDHHPVTALSSYLGIENVETVLDPHSPDLRFDQGLGGELEASLDFPDADEPQLGVTDHRLDRFLRKEMRLARSPAP